MQNVIHLRAIPQEKPMNLICNLCLMITLLKLFPHLPMANELKLLHIQWKLWLTEIMI